MNKLIVSLFLCFTFFSCDHQQKNDLSGEWSFALDPDDVGITEQWFEKKLADHIKLPGSLQEQGFGFDVEVHTKWTGHIADDSWYKAKEYEKYREKGNVKIPFWLQPEKHYVGVAWYQREIDIPDSWGGKYIELELERTHWETTLYVNGKEIGKNNSLHTPHRYEVEQTGKVTLTLRVDNRVHIPVGINAHSVSDHTQSNWNGIIGNVILSARLSLHIDNIQVFPDVKSRKADVVISLSGNSDSEMADIKISGKSFNCSNPKELKPVTGTFDTKSPVFNCTLDMGDDMLTWSEFTPNLYQIEVELSTKEGKDIRNTTFGMREFKAEGTRFHVNGSPVFLRGTLECAIFPLTGYPAMDSAYWEKIYRQCKEFGLNHVRFHSWCPPRVAFEVADREGIYLQVECGGWTNVGDGGVIDQWFYDESERIVKEYGNHPSFCLFLYGNEPGGHNQAAYLSNFVDHWKTKDSRRVYTSGAGWPYIPNADYWNTPDPRIQRWGGALSSIINAQPPKTDYDFREIIQSKTMPTVSHEIGQWCVYPNFKEIPKYTGVLKAKNFEIFQETLNEHHLGDMAEKFLYASGRLQTLCYKADIEAALRTPGFAGFQLLDLHDFPGQGSALVGVLDAFWDTKGYVEGKEYSMFCNRTVPLSRMHKLVWNNDEVFKASIEVSHFGEQPLTNTTIDWEITDTSNNILASGQTTKDLPLNNCIPVADIEFDLSKLADPSQLTLAVKIPETNSINQWNFWVYPAMKKEIGNKPYITTDYNDAVAHAQSGENVLLYLPKSALKADKGGNIDVGFSSIFWNTAWTHRQAPHTLGVYCDPAHPALAAFPNEGHSDYQWWDIVTGSAAIVMDDFPADYRPVVYHVDDWFTNRRLGLLFETKVGKGKMMICGADLTQTDQRPATDQFRWSIEQYMASGKFNPSVELDLKVIEGLLQ
jgi:hypothetical protein